MNEAEYKQRFGVEPRMDDLHRAACEQVGEIGHWFCGVCPRCNLPRHRCGHYVQHPPVVYERATVTPEGVVVTLDDATRKRAGEVAGLLKRRLAEAFARPVPEAMLGALFVGVQIARQSGLSFDGLVNIAREMYDNALPPGDADT